MTEPNGNNVKDWTIRSQAPKIKNELFKINSNYIWESYTV